MSDAIAPALTPSEWNAVLHPAAARGFPDEADDPAEVRTSIDGALSYHADYRRHAAAAALALYGQPFGFTHEELDNLGYVTAANPWGMDEVMFRRTCAKIRALLPPEPPEP